MSYQFLTNYTPTSNADAMYQFKNLLVASAGWTVTLSSDGTTSGASDHILSGNTGTNGLNNPNAWFVLQAPGAVDGYTRQLMFFRDSSVSTQGFNWFIQYSINAHFSGGTATNPPTATDGVNLLGTAKGLEGPLFTTGASFRWQVLADNASPYTFCAFAYPIGGGLSTTGMFMDRMLAGSFPSQDNDPYVMMFSGYNTNHMWPYNTNGGNNAQLNSDMCFFQSNFGADKGAPAAWFRYGLAGQAFETCPALQYAQWNGNPLYACAPFGLGSNPASGNDDLFPVLWGRSAAAGGLVGYKGTSTLFQFCGAQRATGDTITVSTPSDRIVINGGLALPWNGTNPLI